MFNKLLEKPFKLISVIGLIYLVITILLNIFTDFYSVNSLYPFSKLIVLAAQIITLILFIITCIFFNKHFIYYAGLEILVFANLYGGNIYAALFISSILLVLLLTEGKTFSGKAIVFYGIIEILKLLLILPRGVTEFFNFAGLSLFAFCTIGCINLLFRHAYSQKNNATLNIEDLKLSDRQKDCIKEIVLYNTTIKALAIKHTISESAIKKDLAHIYKILGITGKADLKALFIDYKF